MLTFNPDDMTSKDVYKMMTGTIAPRPIAFVTTVATEKGVINAAPFSFFNIVSSKPPIISLSIGRRNGEMKDTSRNAVASGELVVHISTEHIIKEINETAATLSADESELELTSLQTAKSTKVNVPAVAEAKVRFECKVEHHYEIKNDEGVTAADLILARIIYIHMAEDVYDAEKGYILTNELQPVARLAGNEYAEIGKIYKLIRPK
ncbi:flavin reductase family protein [Siminovitchia sp. 179-K 8D1 HS]|uniref:flavin reductase family protein n=1 Tax=Siminovitchia sp. 179-K 8D1 HS TaxID=3142385 RepID=UPI0039A1F07A